MKFKKNRHSEEWKKVDERLRSIVNWLDALLACFNLELEVTCIFRTQDEQDDIYKDYPGYRWNPWPSVHQFFRGIDISVRDWPEWLPPIIALLITNYFKYDSKRPHMRSAIYHDIGHGAHIHIQVKGE
jgi:hypothetical protein